MQRYFVKNIDDKVFKLNERDSYHLTKVMRSKVGEEVEIDCDNKLFLGKVSDINGLVTGFLVKELGL